MPATKSKPKSKKAKRNLYKEVTDRIVSALEEGTVPWRKPWRVEGGIHKNLVSKKDYRGINPFLLSLTAYIEGYNSPYWLTFKQAKALGGNVKRDEHGTIVVFNKPMVKELDEEDPKTGKPKKIRWWLIQHYVVFNIEQCEGIDPKKIPKPDTKPLKFSPIKRAEKVIKGMPKPPTLKHEGNRAVYNVEIDTVTLPDHGQFESEEEYYATSFHEHIHSTRHPSRLNRSKENNKFGSTAYAKEELVAEMGAAMLMAVTGIEVDRTKENTKAYIQSWIKVLKDAPKMVVQAGSQAQRACDYILDELKEGK